MSPRGNLGKDPLTAVPPSRHPFQFWMMFGCLLSGVTTLLGLSASTSVVATLPGYAQQVWGAGLAFGGGFTLLAAFWPDRVLGLLMERIGLGCLAAITALLAYMIYHYNGPDGASTAIIIGAVSLAAIWRIKHIYRELWNLKSFMQEWFE